MSENQAIYQKITQHLMCNKQCHSGTI